MIIIVFGLPGSGKTFFASALSRELGAVHYNTDTLRKELFPAPSYTEKEKEAVYELLLNRSGMSETVVIDGTFFKAALRKRFEERAVKLSRKICYIEVRASESTIRERVSRKRKDSDADFNVYLKVKEQFEEMHEDHLVLWSDRQSPEEMKGLALSYIQNHCQ